MSNLDDDDGIKQFFNKVARHYNINYDERDWQKMEKMLDTENARLAAVRSARWRGAAIGFGILSLSLLIYFFTFRPETLTPSRVENSAAVIDPTLPKNQKDESTLNKGLVPGESHPIQKDEPLFRAQVPASKEGFSGNHSTQDAIPQESYSAGERIESDRAADSKIILLQNESGQNTVFDSSANDLAATDKNFLPSANPRYQAVTSDTLNNSSMKTMKDTVVVETANENEKKEERPFRYSRWSVSLAVAPDFSSTEIFKQASAGCAVGITVQYEFFKRWSLQTGALITNKKYWNMGEEYTNIRPGYWVAKTNGVIPERIDGGCHVLEIPLALRYTMLNTKSSRIQVSAGVSSYVMVYETYHFTFEDPNPTATHDYESDETRNYFLSMGSVSLAYELMIHPKLAIGIEPYMKIPFGEIGWAKLPLYTTGAYLTLRYRFANK